jgi:hypothetical protein
MKQVQSDKAKLDRDIKKTKNKLGEVDEKLECRGEDRNSYANTDSDATLMLTKNDKLGVGYNVQMVTENQAIMGFGVYQDREMIAKVEYNFGMTP